MSGSVDDEAAAWKHEAVRLYREDPEITVAQIADKLCQPAKTVKHYLQKVRRKEKSDAEKQTVGGEIASAIGGSDIVCFKVAAIEGKGLGLVATRDLKRGELVFSERPVLVAPATSIFAVARAKEELNAQFEKLGKDTQDKVMQLHDKNTAADGSGKTIMGIFNTNGLPMGVGSLDGVLCLTISRANHSCVSNCYHGWVDGEERLYAESDISAGEELCTNYSKWHETTEQRQRDLQAKFGFVCTCPACTEDERSRKENDAIRQMIGELDEDIPHVAQTNPAKAAGMVDNILSLYERLGRPVPHSAVSRHCYDAFQLSLSGTNRNMVTAKRWIGRAYQAKVVTDGPKASDTLRFKRFMDNPMSRLQG